ncbi:MAG TPA: vitamin B12 dependent methionine synthase [Spirochaetia bacterium]|nr:vitamin B12 dependent methionine synthase [Spirochaetia bacterium]
MRSQRIVLRPEIDWGLFEQRGGLQGVEELRAEAKELFERCTGRVCPKALVREASVRIVDDLRVDIGGELFESRCLSSNLSGVDTTFVYVATCGIELEELAHSGDGLSSYWVDLIKELALDAVVEAVSAMVAERYGVGGVATMNPGSADVEVWPIEQQLPLFRLLGDVETKIGVRLSDHMLMTPNKSVSGVFFPSHAGWVSCEACTRQGCIGRRAPFNPGSR